MQCIVDGCSGGHFYPRPPRGGRLEQPYKKCEACKISIHALREEGDLYKCRLRHVLVSISIHALREEGDQGNTAALSVTTIFLSTPSARRATGTFGTSFCARLISIHALREEGDRRRSPAGWWAGYFYPRPPRGGRQLVFVELGGVFPFLSTPSARRATEHMGRTEGNGQISIHALREEGDRLQRIQRHRRFSISIHALREEGDCTAEQLALKAMQFLSTPSARRATYRSIRRNSYEKNFYPRPPRGGRRAF